MRAACAGDLNGDGLPDVVSGSFGDGRVELYLNQGGVVFGAPMIITTGHRIEEVALADMDLDGDLDVVFIHEGTYRAVWHKNDGASISRETATLTC